MRSEVEAVKQEPQFAAFVSIDWADKKHAWCLQAAGSEKRESGELVHTPETVEAWVGQLCQRFANRPIAVALEQARGALVFMLSKYEPLHLFPAPSTMSASMRKRCIHRAARMIPAMPICYSICCCSIATSCAACRPIRKPPAGCRTWWRNGASWWMRKPRRPIA